MRASTPLVCLAAVLVGAATMARAADGVEQLERAAEGDDPSAGRWGLSVVPRFTLSNDEGIGGGVRGTAFWYRWNQEPYKTAISFQAYATTRLVQDHFVSIDAIDAFGLPLRVTATAGYYQTLTFNYCGLGGGNRCDRAAAERLSKRAGLVGEEAEALQSRYYLARYLQPYADVVARWRLGERRHKPEVFAGWRAHLYLPGELGDEAGDGGADLFPFPDTAYAEDYPAGEAGLASVVQVGASLDDRDHERDPTLGYFLEGSLRGAAPVLGSRWAFAGANATLRLYVPLLPKRRAVLASRYVVDALLGDAPTMELARVGGSQGYFAFGGPHAGRGIRQQRFLGQLKVFVQEELRTTLLSFRVLEQDLRIGLALFCDVGLVGADLAALTADDLRLHFGAGAGLRVVWNENFVTRIDVGVSPSEGGSPFVYTVPDHPY